MIIAEIGRGLGNSMYVYAAALALAKHHNTELKLDTSYIHSWPRWEKYGGLWEFELGKFNISAKEAPMKEILKHVIKTKFRPIDKLLRKYKLFDRRVVYFPSNGSLEDFYRIPNGSYLWGYLGRERFFRSIKEQIIKEFALKDKYKKDIQWFLDKVSSENSVSIHVRRGDVLKLKNCYILDVDYYKKAIAEIKKKVKNPKFYVFSDNINWCKENFKEMGARLSFVKNLPNTGYHTIEAMKNCKHNILANSSLSWWAGYLNQNKKKIVIAPKHFAHFKDVKIDKDTLPKEWTTLN